MLFRSLIGLVALFACATVASAETRVFTLSSFAGQERKAVIHIPESVRDGSGPAPVVFVLHGQNSAAGEIENITRFHEAAGDRGYITVYPNGHCRPGQDHNFWNVAPFKTAADTMSLASDRAFITMILRNLKAKSLADPRRVFATGFSMGGMMTYRLACEDSKTFAGIAVVAGAMTTPDCDPDHPVSVLHLHSLADTTIPYRGGPTRETDATWPAVRDTMQSWQERLSCETPTVERLNDNAVCFPASCPGGHKTRLCQSFQGGHEWMGGTTASYPRRAQDDTATSAAQLDANTEILDFFSGIPARGPALAP